MPITFTISFAYFIVTLAVFHISEFALAAVYMRDELSWRSLLFSGPYCTAMAFAVFEYVTERMLAPGWKEQGIFIWFGMFLILAGEVLRKAAMVTAKSNFTHDIRRQKRSNHVLVTTGIYRYIRHPGYLGWFVWAVGTQVLLCNPVCCVFFAATIWKFFRSRIAYEEHMLGSFFGAAYQQYAEATPTWIPLIP